MFYIISKKSGRIHREPTRKLWATKTYASERSAKAGITRTIKYYQTAIDEVNQVVAEGKPDYHAVRYNAYRDATDPVLGRTHCFDPNNYEIVAVEDYQEPQVTITYKNMWDGSGPYTRTIGLNDVGTNLDPRSESHWTQ